MAETPRRRVVVTGMGLISPLGSTPDALWASLVERRSGVRRLESLPADRLPAPYGGEAAGFSGDIEQFGPLDKQLTRTIRKGLKVMCRETQMGVAAAQLAIDHAGLTSSLRQPDRTGIVFGTDYLLTVPEEFTDGIRNCLDERGQFHFDRWAEQGMSKVDPLWLLKYLPNMPASHVAIYNDLRGPNNSLTLREASANLAIAEACSTIVRDGADVMLAGATGSRIHSLRTLHIVLQEEVANGSRAPEETSRPFDRERAGMVLGEGAGVVVLEELQHAQARGVPIWGEVIGFGSSSVLTPTGVGRGRVALENVLRQSLRAAGLRPEEVGHLHAHGLSTRRGDADEAQAIRRVWGERPVPVVAAKSYFGNLGAGSGMIELIASLLALHHQQLFPVLNYQTPDPDCPVAVVADELPPPGHTLINLSVTPQGQASAVALRLP